ncbi:MAG: branched-chain amino acid ABC transporter permease [Xanthobacteraceae bacterium]|nr:MAG: branched-chain amino acid ABC transporter permease [Xanthobacteraceae bacterium]
MSSSIALLLVQDGIINGAIYALLAVALVLVFAVTRVIFIPQGEFVTFGALTLTALEAGRFPASVWLLLCLGVTAFVLDLARGRTKRALIPIARRFAWDIAAPLALLVLALVLAPMKLGLAFNIAMTLALVVPMGPLIYRIAFEALAEASVLTLLITAVGVHLAMTGLGLAFFGPEGFRAGSFTSLSFALGPLFVTGQSLLVLAVAAILMLALSIFFGRSLIGKALIASAVSRRGARLVGIPEALSGKVAFLMAALIGTLSGLLIAPMVTIAYDTGFLIGLKGFVAAILAGLASYPFSVLAAIFVGILESFAAFYSSEFKDVVVFMVIIPFLLWRSLSGTHVEEEE